MIYKTTTIASFIPASPTITTTALPQQEDGPSPIKVTCSNCGTPIFEVKSGSIVIIGRHHGKKHVSSVAIEDIFAYWYCGQSPIAVG